MLPLLLGAALVGVFALAKRNPPSPKAEPPQKKSTTDPNSTAGIVAAVAGAAVAGATVGGAVDKALGGTDPNTHTEAEISGAAIGIVAVLAVTGIVSFPVAGIVAGVAVLVYAVGTVFSDEARLQYGQNGATADYLKNWQSVHDAAFTQWRADPKYAALTDAQIERQLTPYVDGYCNHLNNIAYLKWSKVPQSPDEKVFGFSHDQFGRDRGYFVSDLKMRCSDPNWVNQYVPKTEQGTISYTVRRVTSESAQSNTVVLDTSGDSQIGSRLVGASKGASVQSVAAIIKQPSDKNAQQYIDAGTFMCNSKLYIDFCKNGGNPLDGLHAGEFMGAVDSNGKLTFMDKTIYWRDYANG